MKTKRIVAEAQGAVIVLATLDTKASEAVYVRDLLNGYGVPTLLADIGCLSPPDITPDISRDEILAGGRDGMTSSIVSAARGQAVSEVAASVGPWIARLHAATPVAGVLALGGSAGTTIGTAAMRALPIALPKVMVSTLASGQVRHYVGDKDILMLNSIVDLVGLNRVTREILGLAAARWRAWRC